MRAKLVLIFFLYGAVVLYPFGLRVAPTGFTEKLDRPVARLVYLKNEKTTPARVMVEIKSDEIPSEYSLVDNIKVFPRVVTIPAKGKRIVRFRIDPKELEDGEYKVYMYFKELGEEKTRSKIERELEGDEIGVTINMLTNIGIGIYGYVGDIVPKVEIIDEKIIQNDSETLINLRGKILGNCSMRITANIDYLNQDGEKVGDEMVIKRLNRGGEEIEFEPLNVPDGATSIDVTYKTKAGEVIKRRNYSL